LPSFFGFTTSYLCWLLPQSWWMNEEWLEVRWGSTIGQSWLQCMGHLVQYHPVNSYSIHKIGRYQIDSWPGFCFAFH
jgi:hypothetical protein